MSVDEQTVEITATVNGETVRSRVSSRISLADWLRHKLGLTGTHVGCEHGVCGACSTEVGGAVVRSCLMLAAQIDGERITTIDAAKPSPIVKALQTAFFDRAALQCGFCTPGMIMQASELLRHNPEPDRETIRDAISGNYCRCTGYHAIVDAIGNAAAALREQAS